LRRISIRKILPMPYPHKFIKLTFKERVNIRLKLEELYKQGKKRECKRLETIYWSDKGLPFKDICEAIKVSYRSVKGWVSAYQKNGMDGLLKGAK